MKTVCLVWAGGLLLFAAQDGILTREGHTETGGVTAVKMRNVVLAGLVTGICSLTGCAGLKPGLTKYETDGTESIEEPVPKQTEEGTGSGIRRAKPDFPDSLAESCLDMQAFQDRKEQTLNGAEQTRNKAAQIEKEADAVLHRLRQELSQGDAADSKKDKQKRPR